MGDEKTVIAEDQLSWLSGKIKQALPSWATETATEKIGWAIKNNEHRMIGFLVYPGNYSMIPKTKGDKLSAVTTDGGFKDVNSLADLDAQFPEDKEGIESWSLHIQAPASAFIIGIAAKPGFIGMHDFMPFSASNSPFANRIFSCMPELIQ